MGKDPFDVLGLPEVVYKCLFKLGEMMIAVT